MKHTFHCLMILFVGIWGSCSFTGKPDAQFRQSASQKIAVLDFEQEGDLGGTKLGNFAADELTSLLFLEKKYSEIGEMSPAVQPKLLRFLESQRFHRVGGDKEIQVDVWIIAATNADLAEMMEAGKFRRDLYYRLNVREIKLVPLRERIQDIQLLLDFFLFRENCSDIIFSPDILEVLIKYEWLGNVRELRNLVQYLKNHRKNERIELHDLPNELRQVMMNLPERQNKNSLKEIERSHIKRIFKKTGYRIRETAKILGIDRNTLRKKLKKYGIEDDF